MFPKPCKALCNLQIVCAHIRSPLPHNSQCRMYSYPISHPLFPHMGSSLRYIAHCLALGKQGLVLVQKPS